MPAPGIPAGLLGYHGAAMPCDPEDAPWIVQASPGEAPQRQVRPGNITWARRLPARRRPFRLVGRDPFALTVSPPTAESTPTASCCPIRLPPHEAFAAGKQSV